MNDKLSEIIKAFETLRTQINPSQYVKKHIVEEYDKILSLLQQYAKTDRKEIAHEDVYAAIDCLRKNMPITLHMVSPRFVRELAQLGGWTQEMIARLLGTNQPNISETIKKATKEIATQVDDDILSTILPPELNKPVEELTEEDRAMIAEIQLFVVSRYGKVSKDKIEASFKLINMYRDKKIQDNIIKGRMYKTAIDYFLSDFLGFIQKKLRLTDVKIDLKPLFRDALVELRERLKIGMVIQSTDEFDRAIIKAKKRGKWIKKDKENGIKV